MGNNIKGITVEIGGNTGPLNQSLQELNTPLSKIQSELKEVNRQLKFDPSNTTLLKQKQDLLAQSAGALRDKQEILKKAVADAQAQFEKGDLGADKVRAVEREYQKVTSQLKDTEKQLSSVQRTSGTVGEKIKATFLNLGSSIKSAFSIENIKTAIGTVGVAVGGLLKGSLGEAKDAQKANADLAQTLKSTGGASGMTMQSLNALTDAMQQNTTFADDDIKAGEGMLLTFTNIGKSVFPQASAAVLDFAQKMETDPKSAALTLGKALNDPANGLAKLTKSGVTFTDQQKKQITAMQKAGDTAGAQKLMIQELNKEFGGQAAAAAETYDGKQKQIDNTLKNIKETIGSALMPVLGQALKAVAPILKNISTFITQHPKLTAAILAIVAIVGTLVGGLSLASTVISAFGVVMGAITAPMAAAGVAAGGAAVGFGALLLPITLVIAAIAALAIGAVVVVTHWKQISAFFSALWKTVSDAFVSAWNGIKSFFTGLWAWIKSFFAQWGPLILAVIVPFIGIPLLIAQHWGQIKDFFSNLWSGIKSGASTAWNGIKSAIMAVIFPFVNAIENLFTGMKGGISSILNGLKNIFQGAWTAIKNIVLAPVLLICDLVTGKFGKMGSDLGRIWDNIKNGATQVWNGIKQYFGGILQAVSGLFSTVWNAIFGFLSGVWSNIIIAAKSIWNALPGFFSGMWSGITSALKAAWNAIKGFFAKFWADEVQGWKNIWNGLLDFFKSLPVNFVNLMRNIGNAIIHGFDAAVGFITSLPAKMLQWGEDMITGLVNGIKNMIGRVGHAISGVADKIRSFLHFSEPDVGPLVGFHSWWKDMMYGMADDINSNIAPVASAARRVASTVAGNIGNAASSLGGTVSSPAVAIASGSTAINTSGGSSSQSLSNSQALNELASQIVSKIPQGPSGDANLTLYVQVGGDTLATRVIKSIRKQALASGKIALPV